MGTVTEPTTQFTPHETQTELPRPVAQHGRGSLNQRALYADDWDSPETNADIARDFGIT
ncbi:hypothetical protein GCM10009741_02470 [Kribbella lupini]|uniref:Uncharacterized protein n=1 Tax=Kribbella lupini TaxID=291602 RepID=A0ABP4KSC4_9ACTN